MFEEAISPFPFAYIFCTEETSEAHWCTLHPPTQRIPICSLAWEALDVLPLPPHTFFPGRFETGSVFVVFGWGGGGGRGGGGDGCGGGGAGWNDKNLLREILFTSLPVLTFKMLARILDQPIVTFTFRSGKGTWTVTLSVISVHMTCSQLLSFPLWKARPLGIKTRMLSSHNRQFNYSLIVE